MTEASPPTEITRLLRSWAAGDRTALDELVPLVDARMHALAATFLRQERPDHTLQTTALVHEAFLRLVKQQNIRYENREQFFANVARMMRRILVDHARARQVKKRGSGAEHLAGEVLSEVSMPERPVDLVALDDALRDLKAENPQLALIVDLKFFAGFTLEEIEELIGLGRATVQRRWRLARSILYRRLVGDSAPEDD